MRVTPQSLPIPQTQAPSAPSSSLCPENAEKKASEAETEWLHWPYPTTRKPWCSSNRVPLCQATPSIGLYLLLEGPVPTRMLYSSRRKINLQITHTPTARGQEVVNLPGFIGGSVNGLRPVVVGGVHCIRCSRLLRTLLVERHRSDGGCDGC